MMPFKYAPECEKCGNADVSKSYDHRLDVVKVVCRMCKYTWNMEAKVPRAGKTTGTWDAP